MKHLSSFSYVCFFRLDVKLLERWYLLDDKLSPPAYKLKDPDEDFSNILTVNGRLHG